MAPEVEVVVRRYQELSDRTDNPRGSPLTTSTLWAMFTYYMHSHRPEARALVERLVVLAEQSEERGQLVWSLPLLGQCSLIEGRFAEARRHLERALELYDPAVDRRKALIYGGLDARISAKTMLSLVLYLMGYPEQALAQIESAVAWACTLDHPSSLGFALTHLMMVHHYGREREEAVMLSRRLVELTKGEKMWFQDYVSMMRAWAESDIHELTTNVEVLKGSGRLFGITYYLSLVAELEIERGEHRAAILRLDESLYLAANTGEMYYIPEVYRLKALSMLAIDSGAFEVEECLHHAVLLARAQGARLLELRAALDLCRVLLARGRRREGRMVLGEIGGWPAEHPAVAAELAAARLLSQELSC